jgi:predicted glycoside hydrolase/deacetylase ChbG (UPF0249 family)
VTDGVVVCADDYGLYPAIDDAILDLAERGRISAASCITTSPDWPRAAKRLASLAGRIDVGLHLTLVDEKPLTGMPRTAPSGRLPSLPALIAASYAGRLDLAEIRDEIEAQCQAFFAGIGRAPSHLDGHRHTHVLRGIRQLVLGRARGFSPRPWLRDVAEPVARIIARGVAVPKALAISILGRGLAEQARASELVTNSGFSGIYAFTPGADLPALYEIFLRHRGRCPLIMCHPGAAVDARDAIAGTLVHEYSFLGSPRFSELLASSGCRIARLSELSV